MYSVSERAVVSFWRRMPGNAGRRVDGDVLLDEVGYAQVMAERVIDQAQAVRVHRNALVHGRIEGHAETMPIETASRDLLAFLGRPDATRG